MGTETIPKIVEANVSDNGVIIEFVGNKVAFFSAALLYSVFQDAQEIPNTPEEDI
jgi:hypothetical protein